MTRLDRDAVNDGYHVTTAFSSTEFQKMFDENMIFKVSDLMAEKFVEKYGDKILESISYS